jgi:hypothetical protein
MPIDFLLPNCSPKIETATLPRKQPTS